jgi:serine/threonine-protein kinase TTK/MPS1
MQAVHDERVVHADLKPANFVLVTGQVKLIDFGIAKACSRDTTAIFRENVTGTIRYMSPEALKSAHMQRYLPPLALSAS